MLKYKYTRQQTWGTILDVECCTFCQIGGFHSNDSVALQFKDDSHATTILLLLLTAS